MTALALTQLRTPDGVSAARTLLPLVPVRPLLALLAVFQVTTLVVVTINSVVVIVPATLVSRRGSRQPAQVRLR